MNLHYNQNHTKEHIVSVLNDIHECILDNRYVISINENRRENIEFIREYNLNSKKQKAILLNIKAEDFCHTLKNTNFRFEHEILYVFSPQVTLCGFGGNEELVNIYIKFNLIHVDEGMRIVVISFHERNKPITYLFK